MKIESSVIEVLKASEIDCETLRLPDVQLDRKLYLRVSKLLNELGGKWTRAKKAFVFKEDVGDIVAGIVDSGEYTPDRKKFQFFPTPDPLARRLVELAGILPGERCLEPSAGTGNIARHLPLADCVELDPKNRAVLEEQGFRVVGDDFMKFEPGDVYDVVVMNPPFCKGQDARHILHAIGIARRKVVAVASASVLWRTDGPYKELRRAVEQYGGTMESLPDGTFKESDTMVKTALIVVDKNVK